MYTKIRKLKSFKYNEEANSIDLEFINGFVGEDEVILGAKIEGYACNCTQVDFIKEKTGLIEGPLIDLMNTVWTEEVIADYQTMIAAQNV